MRRYCGLHLQPLLFSGYVVALCLASLNNTGSIPTQPILFNCLLISLPLFTHGRVSLVDCIAALFFDKYISIYISIYIYIYLLVRGIREHWVKSWARLTVFGSTSGLCLD